MNRLALAPFALLACGVFLVVTLGHADDPVLKLPAGSPIKELVPKADVAPLVPGKKLELVNKSIKLAGGAALAGSIPPANAKVTPVAPVHASGAKIAYAAPLTFVGPSPSFADGAYSLTPASGAKSDLKLELPTEPGKFYVIDCKLQTLFGSTPLVVTFKRGAATQALTPEDGHFLYTFKSDAAQQTVRLSTEVGATFYGCEVAKIQ